MGVALTRDPNQVELAALERDLKFYPAETRHPQALSREQVDQFNRDGFVSGLRVFDDREVAGLKQYADRIQQREQLAGRNPNFIRFIHLTTGFGWDLINHPKLVSYVRDLLGENVIGWGTAFFIKPPASDEVVAFHQDASYWPLSPSKAVTVWLAIDDVDAENGAMQFIVGSHHHGAATFRPSSPEEHNVLDQTIENPNQYGPTFDNVLKAGEISLHSDLLLHGSGPNTSSRRRCGLTLRYAAADVRASHEWADRGVWVCGADPSGHWRNNPRPSAE